jgi:nucleoside-diphosphate-sugar epimerase
MKILVTGACGFIGNSVIEQLLLNGHTIIATDINTEAAKIKKWFNNVIFKPYIIDKVDNQNLFHFFENPDALIHLSWKGLPNYNELFHLEENMICNYYFLKNLIANGLQNVNVIGTCFEYGMKNGCLNEEMETNPNNAYSIAKDTLRKYLEALNTKFEFDFKWIRLFYIYGEGQAANTLFSQLKTAIANGDEFFNMSGGEQVRDYLSVEEVANNIIKVTTQNRVKGIINCSSNKPISVKELVENYLRENNAFIKLNLGYYPYSSIEPMSFWGCNKKIMLID